MTVCLFTADLRESVRRKSTINPPNPIKKKNLSDFKQPPCKKYKNRDFWIKAGK